MMRVSRILSTAMMAFIATPVLADPGHLIELAGHSHWGALIALGGAAATGLWAVKGKKKPAEDAASAQEDISDAEPQEA